MDDVLDSSPTGTYDGKFYAFGFSESNVGIYYNKKMFKEAGIEDSELPTLQNLWPGTNLSKAISKKLTDHFKQTSNWPRPQPMDANAAICLCAITWPLSLSPPLPPPSSLTASLSLLLSNGVCVDAVVNEDRTMGTRLFPTARKVLRLSNLSKILVKEG